MNSLLFVGVSCMVVGATMIMQCAPIAWPGCEPVLLKIINYAMWGGYLTLVLLSEKRKRDAKKDGQG
jgi:hypothetical protein